MVDKSMQTDENMYKQWLYSIGKIKSEEDFQKYYVLNKNKMIKSHSSLMHRQLKEKYCFLYQIIQAKIRRLRRIPDSEQHELAATVLDWASFRIKKPGKVSNKLQADQSPQQLN